MSFSIPKQRPALLNVQTPAFESPDNTRLSTQPMASNDTPLPLKTESISHVGSPTGPSAYTAQITNNVQTIGSNISSLSQSIHAAGSNASVTSASSTAHLKSATPSMFQEAQRTESKPTSRSLSQSIHAAPMEAPSKHQPITGDPKIVWKVDSNVDSSKRSTPASSSQPRQRSSSGCLGGIMGSIYAMPENHKPTR